MSKKYDVDATDEPTLSAETMRDRALANTEMPAGANPITRILDKSRRKSIAERKLLVREMGEFVGAKTDLDKAIVEYGKNRVKIESLPQILQGEREEVAVTLARDSASRKRQQQADEFALASDTVEHEMKMLKLQRELEQLRNPPHPKQPESKPHVDPTERTIDEILQGGGPYTQKVHREKERLIKERGGEDKLTEEDRNRLADAYRAAAERENSRGR